MNEKNVNDFRISLVIPAYNEEKYIADCLKSVFSSSANFFEIIVVDNNSNDRTREIASSFEGVKVFLEERAGVMNARKRGVDESKGDIIAFIDADTKMINGWYEKIVDKFSDPKVVTLSGPYIYENISFLNKTLIFFYWYFLAIPSYYLLGYMAIFGNFAIRRSVLEKMGGLDTDILFYGDDTDTVRRAHKFGKTIFSMDFKIVTSPRRFVGDGIIFTAFKYMINFIYIILFNKPFTKDQTINR